MIPAKQEIASLVIILLTFCAMSFFKRKSTIKPEPEVETPTWPIKGWRDEYTNFIETNATEIMIKANKESLVPIYQVFDQRELIAIIFQAMAYAESGYNRCLRYEEKLGLDPVTGYPITSEGLMQLSYVDADRYGANFHWVDDRGKAQNDSTKSIFDPIKNLDGAIKVFTKLLTNDPKRTFQDAGRLYWAVLRTERPGFRMFKDKLDELVGKIGNKKPT